MQVALVAKEALKTTLPHVLPAVARALPFSRGRYTLEQLLEAILTQKMLLWVVFDPERTDGKIYGAMLTTEGAYPSLKVLRIEFLAGEEMSEWLREAQTALLRYARIRGLERLEMTGRMGWLPVLEKLGWAMVYVTLERDLNVGEQRVDAGNGEGRQSESAPGVSAATL